MKHLYVVVILALVSTISSISAAASDETGNGVWRLVYAHDEYGQRLEGTKEALLDAVRNGKPVRVYYGNAVVEHAADAQFLTIFEGEVFAQLHTIESQRPVSDPARILFRQPGQKWRSIVGTNGFFTAFMDGNEPAERSTAARWFVID